MALEIKKNIREIVRECFDSEFFYSQVTKCVNKTLRNQLTIAAIVLSISFGVVSFLMNDIYKETKENLKYLKNTVRMQELTTKKLETNISTMSLLLKENRKLIIGLYQKGN